MDLKDIKELIALMRKNDLSVFKLEEDSFKITLKRGTDFQPTVTGGALPPTFAAPLDTTAAVAAPVAASTLREIPSPMVGTFYSAPSPETGPYISVGQEVTEETVICIIEAMKVMNEIKAETKGVVAEIVAENGKPVQFGQALFRLK